MKHNTMKNKIEHTVGTVPKSNNKIIVTEATSKALTHKYMTAHFRCWVQTLQ